MLRTENKFSHASATRVVIFVKLVQYGANTKETGLIPASNFPATIERGSNLIKFVILFIHFRTVSNAKIME